MNSKQYKDIKRALNRIDNDRDVMRLNGVEVMDKETDPYPSTFNIHISNLPSNSIADQNSKITIRSKCSIKDCNNLVRQDKKRNWFDKLCESHHRKKYNIPNYQWKRRKFINTQCVLCGHTGICDRHRIKKGIDGGKYTEGNVLILCAKCHNKLHIDNKDLINHK